MSLGGSSIHAWNSKTFLAFLAKKSAAQLHTGLTWLNLTN